MLFVPASAFADGSLDSNLKQVYKRTKLIDYTLFFTEEQNFYRLSPKLIETIFFGLVELKGNPKRARAQIRAKVLGCPTGQQQRSRCILDRYYFEKRRLKIPNRFVFPVNFTRVIRKPMPGRQDRLSLSWRQETFSPPVIEVSAFFSMLGAALESPYYQVKSQVKQVVFHLDLENHFEIILEDRLVKDLMLQYRQIPQDWRDRIYYRLEGTDFSLEENLGSANVHLKADGVRINNRVIQAALNRVR